MRIAVAVAVTCLSIVGVSSASDVAAAIRRPTEISPQGLDSALQLLAKESDRQVIYGYDVVGETRTNGAHGNLTFDEALNEILSGTGLIYRYIDDRTVTIVSAAAQSAAQSLPMPDLQSADSDQSAAREKVQRSFLDRFRMAQVDQGSIPADSSVSTAGGQSSQRASATLEQIVVTGSRIPRAQQEGTQEVQVYSRQQIEQSGQTTLTDFLNTLPSVSTAVSDNGNQTFLGTGTVRLHGLPTGMTLTLLDGRRLESNEFGYFDLNNIPVSAVERVEVLPTGSSAIYGSDALGGAVNVILAKDFNGLEANVKHGQANGVDETDASLNWGASWPRGSVSVVGSYLHLSELAGSERAVVRDSLYTVSGCDPGNVASVDGANLNGLPTPNAAIPRGINGKPATSDFLPTAGLTNHCSYWEGFDLMAPADRFNALLNAHFELSGSVDVFTQVMFSVNHRKSRDGNFINSEFTVPANNPFNPFGEAVSVDYSYPAIGQYYVSTASFIRPLVGARGSLGGDWHYEVTVSLSRDKTHYFDNYADSSLIDSDLASTNPATSLNLFTDGVPGSAAVMQELVNSPAPSDLGNSENQRTGAQGFVQGSLIHLPAGAVKVVFGSEYDRDNSDSYALYADTTSLSRTTWSLFSETRVPILAQGQNRRESVALTAAVRYDHASDFGGKTTGQGGVEWRPMPSLLLRGGYAMSYRAPLLSELGGAAYVYPSNGYWVDPFRGGEATGTPPTRFGPNPNLQPETGHATDLGVVYSSAALPGLEVSITQFGIDIRNYITWPDTQTLINNPSYYPGGIVRAPQTAQDIANGYLGVITQINNDYYNFGVLSIRGVDFESHYPITSEVGTITPSIALTNTYRYNVGVAPAAPILSYVSRALNNATGFAPRWKATAAVTWKAGPYDFSADGRWVGRYRDYQDSGPSDIVLGNFCLIDSSFGYAFGAALAHDKQWLAGAYARMGAINLFNRLPQKSAAFDGYDPAEADVRGRYVYLQLGTRL